ncbi:MAG TPA: hypothetical protein VHT26_07685 [Trebonia sp.]|jgi:hypothetical protein|nr:hypothetical protein [Trebonia sp.]
MTYDVYGASGGPSDSIVGSGSDRVRVIGSTGISASKQLINMQGRLLGWTVTESTGAAAASVRLWDGASNGGQLVVPVKVATGTTITQGPTDPGIDIEQGVYLEVTAGSADVVIYFRADIPV